MTNLLIASLRPWLRPVGRGLTNTMMKKIKIQNEAQLQKLMLNFIKDIRNEIDKDPKVLANVMALLIGSVVASDLFTGEEMLSIIISHLVENGLLTPNEITEEEIVAMHESSKEEYHH